jgi:hypothetical protein
MKIIKKIEDEFEEAKGFCFVSYRITSWKVEEEED